MGDDMGLVSATTSRPLDYVEYRIVATIES
jgi:hypothetical protein